MDNFKYFLYAFFTSLLCVIVAFGIAAIIDFIGTVWPFGLVIIFIIGLGYVFYRFYTHFKGKDGFFDGKD